MKNKKMNKITFNISKSNTAITLIALIITIIVLLILTGITLNMVIGKNGIVKKAQLATNKTNEAQQEEKENLSELEDEIDNKINGNINTGVKVYTFGEKKDDNSEEFERYKEFTVEYTGYYKLEVWGAQGGSGGNGGYSSGYINLKKGEKLYIYTGGKGKASAYVGNSFLEGGFNGGGNSGIASWYSPYGQFCACFGSGGGATDIRKVKATEGSWYDENHEDWEKDKSLLSRIIVAGGGGGSGYIGNLIEGKCLSGNELMPNYKGTSTMTGNTGNGYAKITCLFY